MTEREPTKCLKVSCQCGWEGEDWALFEHNKLKYCPSCGRLFRAWPPRVSGEQGKT